MSHKLSATHYFVFGCLILGSIGACIQQQFWTAQSFADTALVVFSLVYLVAKYYSAKVIQKYRENNYKTNKISRLQYDIIVNASIHIMMPVALAILYASTVLFVLKYLPPTSYRFAGNFIAQAIDFNKEHIKYPLAFLGIILGILTLTRYISLVRYKTFKRFSKYISFPFKVGVTLSFFLAQDNGIAGNILEYRFNAAPVVSQSVTLNASHSSQQEQKKEQIKKVFEAYIDYIVRRLDAQEETTAAEDTASVKIRPNPERIARLVKHFPTLEERVVPQMEGNPQYKIGDNAEAFTEFHERTWRFASEPPRSSNLYSEALKKEPSFFNDFLSAIAEEETTIHKAPLSENAKITRELLGSFFSEYMPTDKIMAGIPIHKILKDRAVSVLNEKIVNALYTLVQKKTIRRSDLKSVSDYVDKVLIRDFRKAAKSVRLKYRIMSSYYAELTKTATNTYLANEMSNVSSDLITYEDGLAFKKRSLGRLRQELLSKAFREENLAVLRQRLHDRPEYELAYIIDNYIEEKLHDIDKDMSAISSAIRDEKSLQDYKFIRDWFSAGGIFFGLPITPSSTNNALGYMTFYPVNTQGPAHLLRGKIMSADVTGGRLRISAAGHQYVSAMPVNKSLLLGAYNYVYAKKTYPVLIDGFYDDHNREVFAYNRNIIYDPKIRDMLYLSDNFIFDVLQGSVSDPTLRRRLTMAYSAFDDSRQDVRLSRIYDEGYCVTLNRQHQFTINACLKFSVVSEKENGGATNRKYREMERISQPFNANYPWLVSRYPYLDQLTQFASYQALFRSVDQSNVDVSELILGKD